MKGILKKATEAIQMKIGQSGIQFIKFGIVGVSNTVVGYILNICILLALNSKSIRYDYIIANVGSFILSVAWSYYWNNRYVFNDGNENRVWWVSLLRTYISYAFSGIILSNIMAIIWIDVLGISKFIAPILNLLFSVPINFLLNKFWAFRSVSKDENG